MDMYTDWGNLKIVSCEAWLNGAGPGSSTVFRWNGRIGGVHFWVKPKIRTGRHKVRNAFAAGAGAPIGRSGKHQVL
jgi:hypothetical protein